MQKCIACGADTKEVWGDDGHGHCGSVFYCVNGCEPFDDGDEERASTEQANQPVSGQYIRTAGINETAMRLRKQSTERI